MSSSPSSLQMRFFDLVGRYNDCAAMTASLTQAYRQANEFYDRLADSSYQDMSGAFRMSLEVLEKEVAKSEWMTPVTAKEKLQHLRSQIEDTYLHMTTFGRSRVIFAMRTVEHLADLFPEDRHYEDIRDETEFMPMLTAIETVQEVIDAAQHRRESQHHGLIQSV